MFLVHFRHGAPCYRKKKTYLEILRSQVCRIKDPILYCQRSLTKRKYDKIPKPFETSSQDVKSTPWTVKVLTEKWNLLHITTISSD